MEDASQDAMAGIRALALELIKNSPEQERNMTIKDFGDYCSIQLTIRVAGEKLRESLDKAKC